MTFSSNRLALDIQSTIPTNRLFYGDNLDIMQNAIASGSVHLIYLDPPFNSQRNYNLIYTKLTGQPVPEQEEAFCDAWQMDPEKEKLVRNMRITIENYDVDRELIDFWQAWIKALRNTQPRLLAYLVYMFYRLLEMRRILHPYGSIYLHCDPHASHYMKIVMDGIFGHENFRNEITWQRTGAHNDSKRYGAVSDRLLFYTKSNKWSWNPQYTAYSEEYIRKRYRYHDGDGRVYWRNTMTAAGGGPPRIFRGKEMEPPAGTHWRFSQAEIDRLEKQSHIYYSPSGKPYIKSYLDEKKGRPLQDVWTDIVMSKSGKERLGYPTQKPIALLRRIIETSSNPGDVIFDPFCGCGTAIYAAHLAGRKWIGCDIAILSIRLVRDILQRRYALQENNDYVMSGIPKSVDGARELFDSNKLHFQHWAVELAHGFASAKFSGDRGIDGRIYFETKNGLKHVVLSVKGGHITPANMRELGGVLQREEDAEIGGLICLESPTKGMLDEEAAGGIYTCNGVDYHRLQIRTIQDLLEGKWFDAPDTVRTLGKTPQTIMPV